LVIATDFLWLSAINRCGSSAEQRHELASPHDHLVGAGEHHRRHVEAERLGELLDQQPAIGGV
jgi:hypothetical protein